MDYRACLYSKTAVEGGHWITLASAKTKKNCLKKLDKFLKIQPIHHFNITENSLVKLYSAADGFIEKINLQPLLTQNVNH